MSEDAARTASGFQRATGYLRRMDRAVLAMAVIFVSLLAAAPGQARDSLGFTLDALLFISPFLAFSIFVAAAARATGADSQVARVLRGRPLWAIFAAALFGALSPFCSCGVVPVIAALLAAGVPIAPVMAFLIASPIMDPEMFILTAAVLGLPFALAKTAAAIGMGLVSGLATHAFAASAAFASPLRAGTGGCGSSRGIPESAADAAPASTQPASTQMVWTFWREPARRASFTAEARAVGWFLGKWLTLAFLLESLMVAWIPAATVGAWLGGDAWWAIPAAVLVGIPAYLNGFAAIPTVSALLDLGMAQGAALAFMVAGAVTSIPAAMAVFALVKRTVFVWYLTLGLGGSLTAGLAWQAVAGGG